MTFVRKIRKFVRSPRLFFSDAATNAEYRARVEGLDLPPDPAASEDSLRPRDASLTAETLVEMFAREVGCFRIDDGNPEVPVLGVTERERFQAVTALLRMCTALDLAPSYRKKGKRTWPKTCRAVLMDLAEVRHARVLLQDRRSTWQTQLVIQFWEEHDDHYMGPSANRVSRKVWREALEQSALLESGDANPLWSLLGAPPDYVARPGEEVDFVFTWVNNRDPDWRELYAQFRPDVVTDATSESRFTNRDELKYAIRSIHRYAPWVRNIVVVSNCAPPPWLDTDNARVRWIGHEEIFEERDLPTFSSHAIESRLHRIPGLSNQFVYSNDDFLLTRPTSVRDFFEVNGNCRLKLESWGAVHGEPKDGEPDYLNGARNAQRLIERDFGWSPTQLHHHAPQALRVDILREMEGRYPEEFARTSGAKFRAHTDVAVTAFFFHHYAYATGRAVKDETPTLLIQQNHNFEARYRSVLSEQGKTELGERRLSVCVNDGADSHLNERWNRSTMAFLDELFGEPSPFERATRTDQEPDGARAHGSDTTG